MLCYQLAGIGVVAAYTAVITRIIFVVIRRTYGRMVREQTERDGLDFADHALMAYARGDEEAGEG